MVVVGVLLRTQVFVQDVGDADAATVYALLQLLGLGQLVQQLVPLGLQDPLKTTGTKSVHSAG